VTLPNVIGLGFERSGTTSLHYSLAQHPEVLVSSRKEPNHWLFDDCGVPPESMSLQQIDLMQKRSGRTRAAYETLFSGAGPQHKAIVDFSPSYLRFPHDVAPRLCAELPDVKLIVVIRQPLEHARSVLGVWLGRPPSLAELYGALEHNRPGPHGEPGLRDHGDYAGALRPFFEWFPHSQIKILLFDRLEIDLLDDLQRFIGVTPIRLPVERLNGSGPAKLGALRQIINLAKHVASAVLPEPAARRLRPLGHRLQAANTIQVAPPMAVRTRIELTDEFYGERIRDLERLTRLDLTHWRNGHEAPRRAVA